ncbi:MAG: hypothetical protein WAT20_01610, partial [Ferruginibacter sp.]
ILLSEVINGLQIILLILSILNSNIFSGLNKFTNFLIKSFRLYPDSYRDVTMHRRCFFNFEKISLRDFFNNAFGITTEKEAAPAGTGENKKSVCRFGQTDFYLSTSYKILINTS